jgi:predicted AAA+ superfamily ATPase
VGRAFEVLGVGLQPYVERRMKATSPYGDQWFARFLDGAKGLSSDSKLVDPSVQLRVMADCWDLAFRTELDRSTRNVVFELRDTRNKWAHNEKFTADDAYRALDSIERVLVSIDAVEANEIGKQKNELMRLRYEAEAKRATPTQEALLAAPVAGLKPWRDVIQPHDDVARGRFALAEFAADLWQVRRGDGAPEYVDPVEFFRRTFLTQGLRDLLAEALRRTGGDGGVPVVDLQTNFGGGKTHSMIALWHLFSGTPLESFPQELQDLVTESGLTSLPEARRVVLVGTKHSPGQADVKDDGTVVNTLWGELAWQLGGPEGYALLADADATSTNPGDNLRLLFEQFGPCLILIDEWVAYARGLIETNERLAGGTFDTQFSFAQALTEAAREVPGVLLVVSLPASDLDDETDEDHDAIGSELEVGGAGGREALRRLSIVIGRMESSWRPATADESFEIVRRRLFQPLSAEAMVERDATARAFGDFYRKQKAEFPAEASDNAYVKQIEAAYPIHPELFERLYKDWSTLERFQRTRGVLRLMAAVVHALWSRNDQAPLILPAAVTLDDPAVVAELTRNLEDNWKPVIDSDIDGPGSRPSEVDRDFPNLGRYGAAKRVARTVFIGSAPTLRSANRGLEASRVRLGSALPGETVATFGDALGKLSDRCTHLYVDSARYWYATQESVTSSARAEAERLLSHGKDEVHMELARRLSLEAAQRGPFAAVHVSPRTTADVPDEPECRLIVLSPEHPHIKGSDSTAALAEVAKLLDSRGNSPRLYRNMIVVLAPDARRLEELESAAADYLAWKLIHDERETRNLDAHQAKQASTKVDDADKTVDLRLSATYMWALVPSQPDPQGAIVWSTEKVDGAGGLCERTGRKLVNDAILYADFAPSLLRMRLDGVLSKLWEEGHVSVADVWDAFARYVYLPRLTNRSVLARAIENGPASVTYESDGFAVADAFDGSRYIGLVTGARALAVMPTSVIVHPDVAEAQNRAERAEQESEGDGDGDRRDGGTGQGTGGEGTGGGSGGDAPPKHRHFEARTQLDTLRSARDFGRIAEEIISHLSGLDGTKVSIIVEIEATNEAGFSDKIIRTVTENARTLKVDDHGFD